MKRKYILLIFIMALLSIAVNIMSYDKSVTSEQGSEVVTQIPLQIGDWRGTDHNLDPKVYDILETRAILHRSYRNKLGQEVFLSLVYYQETKVDFHAPEGCLGGQGIKTKKTPAIINVTNDSGDKIQLKINKILQIQNSSKTLVYYFYKTGDFIGRNYIMLRLNLVLNKFKESKKSGSLIRVSTPLSVEDNGKTSHNELESFVNSLFPYLRRFL